MNYSQTGIANLALNRIGARGTISNINDGTPNANKVLLCWDYVFQEVLSERDWKFAKTRAALQLSNVVPLYAYQYAWAMPSDYLRFVRPTRKQHSHNDGNYTWYACGPWPGWYHREDWPFYPYVDYKVEAISTGLDSSGNPAYSQFAITNYGGNQCNGVVTCPAKITYIRLISDYTQLLPGFVNCFTYRLAQELAVAITEDKTKAQGMAELYRDTLNSAEAQNETMDYQQDEAGSESWERAGRFVNYSW